MPQRAALARPAGRDVGPARPHPDGDRRRARRDRNHLRGRDAPPPQPRPRGCRAGQRRRRRRAIAAARAAHPAWSRTPWHERVAVFLRAAELISGPWRSTINAATMLGQGKNVYQAEIDAACETIDFLRFNVGTSPGDLRWPAPRPPASGTGWIPPLEGFVLTVSPFNFTAIGSNLNMAVALMGNPRSSGSPHRRRCCRPGSRCRSTGRPAFRQASSTSSSAGGRDGRTRRWRTPSSRRPFYRLERRLPLALADVGSDLEQYRPTRASSARRAERISSSPIRPPTRRRSPRRSSAADSSIRARSARPAGRTSPRVWGEVRRRSTRVGTIRR